MNDGVCLPIELPGLSATFRAGPPGDDLCNHGLTAVRHPPSGRLLSSDACTGIMARFGSGLFRAYARDAHLGEVRVAPYTCGRTASGLLLHWRPWAGHPVDLTLEVVPAGTDAVDLTISCAFLGHLPAYHLLFSSYLAPGVRPRVPLCARDGIEIIAPQDRSEWHGLWPFFPRDESAAHLLSDGRGRRGRWPWRVVCLRDYGLPLVASGFDDAELRLIGLAQDVLAVGAAYAGDEAKDSVADHRSLYLALFGRDAHPGDGWRTRVRIQVAVPGDRSDWSSAVAGLAGSVGGLARFFPVEPPHYC